MKIVSDQGMDLMPEQLSGLEIELAPLMITLDGQSDRFERRAGGEAAVQARPAGARLLSQGDG